MRIFSVAAVFIVITLSCFNHSLSTGSVRTPPVRHADAAFNFQAEKQKISHTLSFESSTLERIDFKNFSYPTSFCKRPIKLTDGQYQITYAAGAGGDTFDFRGVNYIDVVGDHREEAIVRLTWVSCDASCDGGSDLFYLYSLQRGAPRLVWHFETGSSGYECGLKSLSVVKGRITIEVFRTCRFDGIAFKPPLDVDERGGKFIAGTFTRLVFRLRGSQKFLLTRKVLPNPAQDIKNYEPRISFNKI